eukprot:Cvel_24273.t1-p1 / transcript=Cvel_24273.t1 / gene=Cvel_24273 / organism=Chromera_velia_CCMP2878 / gene_product=hypothetical protein / transcript_product=hypothetical protein / location=Cvel_scaffold2603:19648-22062(+) / protein_length=805 / sequence_SO=supercontig / SO=protein_coding / is_pseudo=false
MSVGGRSALLPERLRSSASTIIQRNKTSQIMEEAEEEGIKARRSLHPSASRLSVSRPLSAPPSRLSDGDGGSLMEEIPHRSASVHKGRTRGASLASRGSWMVPDPFSSNWPVWASKSANRRASSILPSEAVGGRGDREDVLEEVRRARNATLGVPRSMSSAQRRFNSPLNHRSAPRGGGAPPRPRGPVISLTAPEGVQIYSDELSSSIREGPADAETGQGALWLEPSRRSSAAGMGESGESAEGEGEGGVSEGSAEEWMASSGSGGNLSGTADGGVQVGRGMTRASAGSLCVGEQRGGRRMSSEERLSGSVFLGAEEEGGSFSLSEGDQESGGSSAESLGARYYKLPPLDVQCAVLASSVSLAGAVNRYSPERQRASAATEVEWYGERARLKSRDYRDASALCALGFELEKQLGGVRVSGVVGDVSADSLVSSSSPPRPVERERERGGRNEVSEETAATAERDLSFPVLSHSRPQSGHAVGEKKNLPTVPPIVPPLRLCDLEKGSRQGYDHTSQKDPRFPLTAAAAAGRGGRGHPSTDEAEAAAGGVPQSGWGLQEPSLGLCKGAGAVGGAGEDMMIPSAPRVPPRDPSGSSYDSREFDSLEAVAREANDAQLAREACIQMQADPLAPFDLLHRGPAELHHWQDGKRGRHVTGRMKVSVVETGEAHAAGNMGSCVAPSPPSPVCSSSSFPSLHFARAPDACPFSFCVPLEGRRGGGGREWSNRRRNGPASQPPLPSAPAPSDPKRGPELPSSSPNPQAALAVPVTGCVAALSPPFVSSKKISLVERETGGKPTEIYFGQGNTSDD